jgi:pyridoxine 4-dehydrogenase
MTSTRTPRQPHLAATSCGDLRVKRLGLRHAAAIAILRRAVELGVKDIDTAGFYGFGGVQAHELIRWGLSPHPEDLVIATNVGPLIEGVGPTGQASADRLREPTC